MSRLIGICGAWLAFLGGAAAADPSQPTTPRDAVRTPPVKEITIDPTIKEPVCRRQAPTGSRIVKARCEAPSIVSCAERDQLRRDLEEMRMRETMQDQGRGGPELEALRRRAGF